MTILLSLILATTPLDTLWTRTYGTSAGESAYHLVEAPDGGFVLVGYTKNTIGGDMNIYIVKTDAFGELEWERNIGYSDTMKYQRHDKVNYVLISNNMDIILTGLETSHSKVYYCYLMKMNLQGDTLWWKTYGPQYGGGGRHVQQTSDGGYLVTGTTLFSTAGPSINGDVFLLKTDINGNEEWLKTYDFEDFKEYGYGTIELPNVGYYVYGALSYMNKAFLMLVDYEGNFNWIKTFIGQDSIRNAAWFYDHLVLDDGILFTGTMAEMWGLYIYTDWNGEVRWWKEYFNNNQRTFANNTVLGTGGDLVSVLKSHDSLTVFKMSTTGDSLWTKKFGFSTYDSIIGGNKIIKTKDGGYAICGYKGSKENVDIY